MLLFSTSLNIPLQQQNRNIMHGLMNCPIYDESKFQTVCRARSELDAVTGELTKTVVTLIFYIYKIILLKKDISLFQ